MSTEIINYNAALSSAEQKICDKLMDAINKRLTQSTSKLYHGSPVWFIDGNPIVGYSKLKDAVQLLFWSGQSFDEEGLKPTGKHKAAEARYTNVDEIDLDQLSIWLNKSFEIQWDYKNVAKRKGELLRLK